MYMYMFIYTYTYVYLNAAARTELLLLPVLDVDLIPSAGKKPTYI